MAKTTKQKRKYSSSDEEEDSPSSSSSSPSPTSSDEESNNKRRSKSSSRRREKEKERERRKRKKKKEKEKRKRRSSSSKKRRSKRDYSSDDDDESLSGSGYSDHSADADDGYCESVVKDLLLEFPAVASDLLQLLQMIDNGQAVDIKGISEKPLKKYLKKLFVSLDLKEKGDRVFLLRSNAPPTLEVIGPIIASHLKASQEKAEDDPETEIDVGKAVVDDVPSVGPCPNVETSAPKRRVIGPEMPSAELLAAAAKLTEAEAEMRDAELEQDNGVFIGPPPPAVVNEVASTNEAERFEEVTRIMGVEADNPYDVVGVNHNMSADNIKKRYWKLSLMVHPDKCSHPQAHQAFIKLNKAFKDLQDPDKRKAMDDKIKKKEDEEEMKAVKRSMREAAFWRRSQGMAMEGDDELLAEEEVKGPPKRDEWMTTLPPEKKPGGMPMHSTVFSRTTKEGRGDTSAWTETPSDRAQKAKTNYLEAYNQATALASNEEKKKVSTTDADLVDQYNKAKRSKTLVQKHQEEAGKSRSKKKSKQGKQQEEGDWAGNHPWKPWDREKDLSAGRQSVKLDPENMSGGLTNRFSSSTIQRSFL